MRLGATGNFARSRETVMNGKDLMELADDANDTRNSFWHVNIGHLVPLIGLVMAVGGIWLGIHDRLNMAQDDHVLVAESNKTLTDMQLKLEGISGRVGVIEGEDLPKNVTTANEKIATMSNQIDSLTKALDKSQKDQGDWQVRMDTKVDALTALMARIAAREEVRSGRVP